MTREFCFGSQAPASTFEHTGNRCNFLREKPVVRRRDTVAAGLRMLVDYEHVLETKVKTSGRPTFVYTVNPKALLA
jgi:hypothetical protein